MPRPEPAVWHAGWLGGHRRRLRAALESNNGGTRQDYHISQQLVGHDKAWSLTTMMNLRYFRQSIEVAVFFVASCSMYLEVGIKRNLTHHKTTISYRSLFLTFCRVLPLVNPKSAHKKIDTPVVLCWSLRIDLTQGWLSRLITIICIMTFF